MKISELLNEAAQPKKPAPKQSNLPSAPRARSIDDEPHDEESGDDAPVNAEREFKQDAASLGDGLYALSAWVYPEAWFADSWYGSPPNDLLMHRITTLADELDIDIGDYQNIPDRKITNDRRLEIVFYNSHTQMMFRLSASGLAGSRSVEFTPTLVDLQQSGLITNSQFKKLQAVETTVSKWCDTVPEEAAVIDARGRPDTRKWKTAEDAVLKLFSFDDQKFDSDDAISDPDNADFWSGSNVHQEPSPEGKKADDEFMQKWREEMRAKMAAKAAKKNAGPGREKR